MPGMFTDAADAPIIVEMPQHTIKTRSEPFKAGLYDEALLTIETQITRKRYRKTFMTETTAKNYAASLNSATGVFTISAVPMLTHKCGAYDVIVDEYYQQSMIIPWVNP